MLWISLSTHGSGGFMVFMCFLWWWNRKFRLLNWIWPWRCFTARSTLPVPPQTMGFLTKVYCTNLVVLARIDDELWCGQAQNGINSNFKLNLTLKVKVDRSTKNRDLNKGLLHIWTKFGDLRLNGSRVIVRISKWLTYTRTDRQTDTHGRRQP